MIFERTDYDMIVTPLPVGAALLREAARLDAIVAAPAERQPGHSGWTIYQQRCYWQARRLEAVAAVFTPFVDLISNHQ